MDTAHGVRVVLDDWDSDAIWMELECCSAHIHVIMTPEEAKRVIDGLQDVIDYVASRNTTECNLNISNVTQKKSRRP
jgi:hypothetical protein